MAIRPTSYVPHRWAIYSLLWAASVIELALTAFRIRHTNSVNGTFDPIVVELLVTSILTILWVPVTLLFHRSMDGGAVGTGAGRVSSPRHGETGGNLILWIMWLVGAAIVTVSPFFVNYDFNTKLTIFDCLAQMANSRYCSYQRRARYRDRARCFRLDPFQSPHYC